MVTNKNISKIIVVIVAIAVILCFLAIGFKDKLIEINGGKTVSLTYETKLFDTNEIIDIDILMDEDEWQEMLDNATSEEYYQCDVVVNGTTFYSVAIRPKGNTSLTSIASDPDNNRYSFKLEFDHFVDGQTCFGLDKLILNNNYADATNMKEAIAYDMFQFLGADASLYNYAKIKVNGEYFGVYLALEAVEDSFMLRNYGVKAGELYKPDSMNMGGGKEISEDFDFSDIDVSNLPSQDGNNFPSMPNQDFNGEMPENFDTTNIPEMSDLDFSDFSKGGGFSTGSNGADLNYSDDELDSYSTIWDGAITDSNDTDHKRVIKALKNINQGTDLETYLDVDNVLKYMAVQSFVVNDDSLSGSMAHNYYLYEYDGKLNIIPWDYNLSFGGMGMSSNASSVINDPIDSPFSITNFFDALLNNEEYLERYHEYYRQLVEEYVNGGEFDSTYSRIRTQIDELVKTDPNAMYSYDEYDEAAQMLNKTVKLRAQSVLGQLNGTIPSTTEGQKQDSSNLIDASSIKVSVMGTFQNGGFDESDFPTNMNFDFNKSQEDIAQDNSQEEITNSDNIPEFPTNNDGNIPTPPDNQNMPDELPEDFDPSSIDDDIPQGTNHFEDSDDNKENIQADNDKQDSNDTQRQEFNVIPNQSQTNSFSIENIIIVVACMIIVIIAIVFAKNYHRKL